MDWNAVTRGHNRQFPPKPAEFWANFGNNAPFCGFLGEGTGYMSQVSPPAGDEPEPSAKECCSGALSLEALVLAHHSAVYRYAFRLTGAAAEAEDLVQQTFLIAHQKLHQLRQRERAGGWLFAIARTSYLMSLAKWVPGPCDYDVRDVAAENREILDVDSQELQQVLCELPAELRVTLVLFYFEDLSYKEIADELAIPIGTVMSRLSRAKERLRARLGVEVPNAAASRKHLPRTHFSVEPRSTSTPP